MRGDSEPLLGEPATLDLVAHPDAADDRLGADLDVGEANRRVAVRIGVRERRIVDELDAVGARLDEEQRRQALAAVDDVGDDDQHARDVARGHEPLLAGDQIAAAIGGHRDRRDPRRIGAGVGLGHRVGVAALAPQRRRDVALELLGRRVGPDVVDVRHPPVQAVGAAAELLVDEEPLEHRPSLAAALGRRSARRAAGPSIAARLISSTVSAGNRPSASSAGTSSGISTSSTNRRARSRSSRWSSVSESTLSSCRHAVRPFGRRCTSASGRRQAIQPRPVAGGQPRSRARQRQQQVVMVGEHRGRAHDGAATAGSGLPARDSINVSTPCR